MKSFLRLLVLAGLVMSFHASVEARPGGGKRFIKKIMMQLDLTEEQKVKLQELKQKNKPLMKAARDKVKAAHEKLDSAFSTGVSDADLTKLHNELMVAMNAKGAQRFSGLLEIRNVLTAEQKAKFDSLKAEMKEKHRAKRMERKKWLKERNGE